MKDTMTPEESLQIIQKTISNSRKNMREGSFYYHEGSLCQSMVEKLAHLDDLYWNCNDYPVCTHYPGLSKRKGIYPP